jgi:uncharacterized protein YkwD
VADPARMAPFLAAVVLSVFAHTAGDDPLLAPAGACDAATPQATMLCFTNYARTQSGLQPLRANTTLDAVGDAKLAADVSCGEFSHTPCGSAFMSGFTTYLAGATSYTVGENIAWGTGGYAAARETMNGWLHSPGHRANVLGAQYTELGIGYLPNVTFQGYDGATLWSQEFGRRSAPAAKPAPKAKHPRRRRTSRR